MLQSQHVAEVLVSYNYVDENVGGPWVTRIFYALASRLEQLLGRKPTVQMIESRENLPITKPKVLVCVISNYYLNSIESERELASVLAASDQNGLHLVRVDLDDIPLKDLPPTLRQLLGVKFYNPGTGRRDSLFQASTSKGIDLSFWQHLDELANTTAALIQRKSEPLDEYAHTQQQAVTDSSSLAVTHALNKMRELRVFLCHSSTDKAEVRGTHHYLRSLGADTWFDEEKLLPGQRWETEITRAVKRSDAVLVFLSKTSIAKIGYVQKELRHALEVAKEQPEDAIFIVPARLDACSIPDSLSGWHCVDLFEDRGRSMLVKALRARAVQLSVEHAAE